MSKDYSRMVYLGSTNAFKNTGVYLTSISLPTTAASGVETTNSVSITLAENQVFSHARAKYTEIVKDGAPVWQVCNTFDGKYSFTAPFAGSSNFYLTVKVVGNVITFTVGVLQTTGSPMTITPQTIQIAYTTYTLAK